MSASLPLYALAGIALSAITAGTLIWVRRPPKPPARPRPDAGDSSQDSSQLPPHVEYEQLFSLSPHPMYVYDTETLRLLSVNDAALRRYGYERGEFLKLTLSDIRPDEDVPAMKAMTTEVLNTRSVALPGIWRHKRKDGSLLDVRLSGHELLFAGRKARLVHAVDVSAEVALQAEREQMIGKLQTSREWLASTVNAGRIGLWERDLQAHSLILGGRWAEIIGTTAKAFGPVTEERFMAQCHPDDLDRVSAHFIAYLKNPSDNYVDEYRLKHATEGWVWVMVRGRIGDRDSEGHVRRMTGTFVDITSLKTAQEALARQQAAEQANAMKTQFLSRVSHELRTPLNAVLGFAQLLQLDAKTDLTTQQSERVNHIERAGQHLLALINDLMDLSRLELGTFDLQDAPVHLALLLDEAFAMVDVQVRGRGITVERHFALGLPPALGDPLRLRQCVLNILSNAIKYNAQGGTIRAELSALSDGRLDLSVWNSGVGMTPQQLERLYEPFNRLGRDASHAEGTGIGLAISRQLVERMGGEIAAESVAGEWTRFSLRLRAVAS